MTRILMPKDREAARHLLGNAIAVLLSDDEHDDELAIGFIEEALDYLKE